MAVNSQLRLCSSLAFLLFLSSIGGIRTARRRVGRTLVTITPHTEDDVRILHSLVKEMSVDLWDPPRYVGQTVRFVVEDGDLGKVSVYLAGDFQGDSHFEDLEALIAKHTPDRRRAAEFNLYDYNDHSVMNTFLAEKADSCDICKVESIGKSLQGRDMLVFRIGDLKPDKRAVWIDAGIHAREWVAPATALYFIEQLASGYNSGDKEILSLLKTYVIYILPSANPDGYQYSRTSDRMWRKTMHDIGDHDCVGVDPNRNWDFHWNEVGASNHPCSEIFAGTEPFSEVEIRNIAEFLWRERARFDIYLTMHAYGQLWLSPWGFTSDLPDDYDDMEAVADAAVAALAAVHGTKYTAGTSTNVLYSAAGGSDDWVKGVAGIKYAYTLELRDKYPPEGQSYGFLMPPEMIKPTAAETWEAVKVTMHKVKEIEGRK